MMGTQNSQKLQMTNLPPLRKFASPFYWQTETRFLASSQKGKNSFSIQNKNDRDANFWLNFQRRGMFQTLETQSESALVIRSIFPSPCLRRQPGLDGRRWISIYCNTLYANTADQFFPITKGGTDGAFCRKPDDPYNDPFSFAGRKCENYDCNQS